MVAFPTADELATVQTSDQRVSFRLTQADVLWTARAASREDPPEASIIVWAFTQRAVLFKLGNSSDTYTSVLRGFSQPINPIWARDGSMCRPGGKYAGHPECSEDKLKAREWYTNATWEQLNARYPDVVQIVSLWATGRLVNRVPRVTNFAAPKVAQSFLNHNPKAELFYKGDNWYIVDAEAVSWPSDYVTMSSPLGAVAMMDAGLPRQSFLASVVKGFSEWWRIG